MTTMAIIKKQMHSSNSFYIFHHPLIIGQPKTEKKVKKETLHFARP